MTGRSDFVSPAGRQAGTALLVAGYAGAIWAFSRAVPMFRQRRGRRFLAAEAATATVALGWTVRGRALPAAVNAVALAALAAAWWLAGRGRRT